MSKKPVFPELRNIADAEAASAQRHFLLLNIAQLSFMSLAAFVSGFSLDKSKPDVHMPAWAICVTMAIALACTTALRLGKFDVRWFKCRAFAENAKSLAWRYIMVEGDDCHSPRDSYLLEWARLRERLPELQGEFALAAESGSLVTDWMEHSATLPINEKLVLYRRERVHDQISWYARNAKKNAKLHSRWFWALLVLEATSIGYAIFQAYWLPKFNAVGLIVSIGSAIVAWTQVKRYSDLSTSYAIASDDLTLISEKFKNVVDHKAVNEFVENVEDAVSREHSMWLARRNC